MARVYAIGSLPPRQYLAPLPAAPLGLRTTASFRAYRMLPNLTKMMRMPRRPAGQVLICYDDRMNPETTTADDNNQLLTPSEVAAIFRVDPKTVTRWAMQGKLTHTWTPGGHRRYRRSVVEKIIQEG